MTSASLASALRFDSFPNESKSPSILLAISPSFLNALPLACAIFDKHGEISAANDRFHALLNCNEHDYSIRGLYAYLGIPTGLPSVFSNYSRDQDFRPTTVETTAKSGQRFTLNLTPISLATGEQQFLACLQESPEVTPDMYRNRDLHARLLHATRAQSVGEMTTILSHELNQPLGAIVNYLDAAQMMLAGSDHVPNRAKDALRLAQAQAHQAGAVVARIREFVSSRQTLLEPCDIGSLIKNSLDLLQWELQRLSIQCTLDISDTLPMVKVDGVLLGQVLTNLVHNAIDAMRGVSLHTRFLRISACLDLDERIVVRVCDSGTGVSPADARSLFKPFFTTKPKGMGIGLSISRSIMELHAGSLYHERNPEGGSIFCFTLPTQ